MFTLQQYLPLAVLKLRRQRYCIYTNQSVATVLTACGIETITTSLGLHPKIKAVATVLTACGIETIQYHPQTHHQNNN